MHGTSTSPVGQRAFLETGPEKAPQAAENGAEIPLSFLIHTNKSGGRCGSLNTVTPSVNKDASSVIPNSEAENLQEPDGIFSLPRRLDRYAGKVSRSIQMGQWIASQARWKNWHPVGRRVAACGSYLQFHEYFRKDAIRLIAANNCCNALLCPFCAGLRGARHLKKAIQKIRAVMTDGAKLVPYLWTVTIKDESGCKAMYKRLRGLIGKVLQMRRDSFKANRVASAWAGFDGGIISVEVKKGKNSKQWHLHAHAIILGASGLDPVTFQRAWSDLVGYWAQSDLQPLRCTEQLLADRDSPETEAALAKDLQEVFKYAVKCSDMDPEDNFEAFRELQGQRLIRTFGSLYGLKLADDDVVDTVDDLEGEPYRDLWFNLISGPTGRYYKLIRTQEIQPGPDGHEVVDVSSDDPFDLEDLDL